jgi:hypothetical protein
VSKGQSNKLLFPSARALAYLVLAFLVRTPPAAWPAESDAAAVKEEPSL